MWLVGVVGGSEVGIPCHNARQVSVESIRPLPKAPLRKTSRSRRTRKTAILTDTPEKNALAEEQEQLELMQNKSNRDYFINHV